MRVTPKPDAIPGFRRKPGEVVIGTLAGLREVKDLPMLVRAVGGVSARVRLVIVGEGPERQTILDAAERMGIENQLVMPGFLPRTARVHRPVRHHGAVVQESEQFPICVLEGMAAGFADRLHPGRRHPPHGFAPENRSYIENRSEEVTLRDGIEALAQSLPEARAWLGAQNRAKAVAEYDEAAMIARYAALYGSVIGRPGAFI